MTICPASASGSRRAGMCRCSSNTAFGKQQRRRTFTWVPGTLPAIRKEAAVVPAQAKLGKDVVGEARKAQQEAIRAAKATLGQLIGPYLELREKGKILEAAAAKVACRGDALP